MANIITGIRIVLSAALLIFPALSPAFFVLYAAGGLSDMIDGTVARRTGTVSGFGSGLDTFADIVFAAVCLIKLLPVLDVPVWLYVWVAVIAFIKFSSIIAGLIRQKQLVSVHSVLNKAAGLLLFVFPLTLAFMDLRYSAAAVCMAATAAAIQEGFTVWARTELCRGRKEMVKYEMIDLPGIAIIGKEGLCTKEKNIVQDLWRQANSNFSDIADLGMKNADGSFVGLWGAMSDETLSFLPWTDGFSRGLYLAGIEVYEDTPAPDGWVKWVMPARKYLVTEVTPESYGETFRNVIDCLIPELGMKLAGAVCDFTEPATGQNKLFFPVE